MSKEEKNWLAFDKTWFVKNQKPLLQLCNSFFTKYLFRKILRIDGKCSSVGNNKIELILPNAIWWIDKEKVSVEFRTHWKFAKRLYFAFKPIWWVAHYWDELIANKYAPQWSLGFDTLTAYPQPSGGADTCNGSIRYYSSTVFKTWSAVRTVGADVPTDAVTNVTSYNFCGWKRISDTEFANHIRGFFHFDTSSIGDTDTINSSTISLYPSTAPDTGMAMDVCLVASTTAANNSLATSDYDSYGSTEYITRKANTDFTTGAYVDMALNASGLSFINKTGVTKFCFLSNKDLDNVTPNVGTWTSAYSYFADQTGTTNDPKLVVNYSTAGGGAAIVIPTALLSRIG